MPGLVSSSTLEQIRSASDIVDVIGAVLPLKRAGANFVALCPFHKEKSPSFNVNPHRQIFHCFGCHKGGDVFTFLQQYENITFPEALQRLADRAGIALAFDRHPGQEKARFLKDTLLQIHEQITQRWHSALSNEAAGQIARDYLAKRRVPDEAVQLFRLGYAPDAWDDTVNWAKSKAYELALVEQAGLILRKEGTDHFYDRFRGRLIFPICDEQGRVVAFSGRVLAEDVKAAKYVNSPETPIFTKGKIFFGLDKSKRAILDAQRAVICEGQLDLIACYLAGVRNVVAPQGTAFTPDHARLLKRYADEVVLCFDSDAAGQSAAVRVLDSLLASGLAIRVAVVPAPHDPDSFIKEHGGAAFQKLIDQAAGFFDYFLDHLCSTHDVRSDKGRKVVVKEMAEAVRKTGDAVLIDKYAQATALRLEVLPSEMRAAFKEAMRSPGAASQKSDEIPERETTPVQQSKREFWLLKLLLLNENQSEWVAAHLDPNWLQDSVVRRIIAKWLALQASHQWPGVAGFMAECEEANAKDLISEAVADPRAIPDPEKQLSDCLVLLRDQFIDRQLKRLTPKAMKPDLPEAERNALLQQQQELRKSKLDPLSPFSAADS